MEKEYKDPEFDPKTLKVSQLRSVLDGMSVEYPAHLKKAELVALFKKHVRGKKSKKSRSRSVTRSVSPPNSKDEEMEVKRQSKKRPLEEEPKKGKKKRAKALDIDRLEGDVSDSGDFSTLESSRLSVKSSKAGTPVKKTPLKELPLEKDTLLKSSPLRKGTPLKARSVTNSPNSSFAQKENETPVKSTPLKQTPIKRTPLKQTPKKETPVKIDDTTPKADEIVLIPVSDETPVKATRDETPSAFEEDDVIEIEAPVIKAETPRGKLLAIKSQLTPIPKPVVEEPKHEDDPEILEDAEVTSSNAEDAEPIDVSFVANDEDGDISMIQKDINEEITVAAEKMDGPSEPSALGCFLVKFLSFLAILLPILFALWYREQRILVGYCGKEIIQPTFVSDNEYITQIESCLAEFRPECIECPENGVCFKRMELECKPGYVVSRPWTSMYGLLPVSDVCVKDTKKDEIIEELISKALDLLRIKNAMVECGDCEDNVASGIDESDLYQIFYESKSPWMNDAEFEELWAQAMEELVREPEVTLAYNPENTSQLLSDDYEETEESVPISFQRTFRSSSKANVSLKCYVTAGVANTLRQLRLVIAGSVTALALGLYLKAKIEKYFETQKTVQELCDIVVAKLQAQVQKAKNDENIEAYISHIQLRDVLIKDTVNLQEKNDLWKQVARKVEANTNVKATLFEVHGEIMRVWEWVGVL